MCRIAKKCKCLNKKEICFDTGANYQRLKLCLELLEVLHNCYISYQPTGMNKGSGAGSDPTEVVRHVQDAHQLMHFYTDRQGYIY